MRAREYLESQLKDGYPEASSVQTRKGLAAYAIRLHSEVEGYSLSDAEKTIRKYYKDEVFVNSCLNFISNINNYEEIKCRIPELDD